MTKTDKLIAYLTLFTGLVLSIVAEYYSIVGLTAIFSASMLSVIIMGITLGIGKIVATLWLKWNWNHAPLAIKTYLSAAISVLMLVTAIGIFGFLSKAHSDQTLVSGEVVSKIAIYDEKIKTARENIDANRRALKQMDEAIDQTMSRSTSEAGAERAVAIRRSQTKERTRLLSEIQTEQQTIAKLNEERAPIAAEVRKVEAEVGPIKYLAAFIYGDTNPEILEKSVTWLIIIIIFVFDPLAIMLLLSSQISFQRIKEDLSKPDPALERIMNYDTPVDVPKETEVKLSAEPQIVSEKPADPPISDAPPEPAVDEPESTPRRVKISGSPNVAQRTKVFPKASISSKMSDSLYVQNEEQQESSIWSNTSLITKEEYINKSKDSQNNG